MGRYGLAVAIILVGLLRSPTVGAALPVGKTLNIASDTVPLSNVAIRSGSQAWGHNSLIVWVTAGSPGQPPRLMGRLVGEDRRMPPAVEIARLDSADAMPSTGSTTVDFNAARSEYLVLFRRAGSGLYAARIDANGRVIQSDIVIQADPAAKQPRVASYGTRSLIVWADAEGIKGRSFDPTLFSASLGELQIYAMEQAELPAFSRQSSPYLIYQVLDGATLTGSSLAIRPLDQQGSPSGPANLLISNAADSDVSFYAGPQRRGLTWVRRVRPDQSAVYVMRGRRVARLARAADQPRLIETARAGQSLLVWSSGKSRRVMARFMDSRFRHLTRDSVVSRARVIAAPAVAIGSDAERAEIVWGEARRGNRLYQVKWRQFDTSGTVQKLDMSIAASHGFVRLGSLPNSSFGGGIAGSSGIGNSSGNAADTSSNSKSVRYTIWIHNPTALTATGVNVDFTSSRLSSREVKSRSGGKCRSDHCDLPDLEPGGVVTILLSGTLECRPYSSYSYDNLVDARLSWANSPRWQSAVHRSRGTFVRCGGG